MQVLSESREAEGVAEELTYLLLNMMFTLEIFVLPLIVLKLMMWMEKFVKAKPPYHIRIWRLHIVLS